MGGKIERDTFNFIDFVLMQILLTSIDKKSLPFATQLIDKISNIRILLQFSRSTD